MYEKRPRQYAAEIMKLRYKEDRLEALNNVPEHLRDAVKKHVDIQFFLMRVHASKPEQNQPQEDL